MATSVDKRAPGTRMAAVARLLASHQSQLDSTGAAAFICDRREIGRPANFLQVLRRVLPGTATAAWVTRRWPRGSQSNVLVVTMDAEVHNALRGQCQPVAGCSLQGESS
jgi:hypothetical protein